MVCTAASKCCRLTASVGNLSPLCYKVAHAYSTTDDQVGAPPVPSDRARVTEEPVQRLDQPGDGGKARQQSHLQVYVQTFFAGACLEIPASKALLTQPGLDHLTHRGR